jgi:hypothetical protein
MMGLALILLVITMLAGWFGRSLMSKGMGAMENNVLRASTGAGKEKTYFQNRSDGARGHCDCPAVSHFGAGRGEWRQIAQFDFFFQQQKPFGEIGGGIVQAIVGTLMCWPQQL